MAKSEGASSGAIRLLVILLAVPLVTLALMVSLYGTRFLCQEPRCQRSVLGSFLIGVTNASVKKKAVGILTGSNNSKATFTAIVAWDPGKPAVKVKGIEVRLAEGGREAIVYVDEDKEGTSAGSLAGFQEHLSELVRLKDEITKRCQSGDQTACNQPGITAPGEVTTGALNLELGSQRNHGTRITVFNAGWYGRSRGVVLNCASSDAAFLFADAKLDDVVKAIAEGRAFLDAN